jgi:hypothetical protein
MKTFIQKYNGWISLAVALIMSVALFFCGPDLYRMIDPEAGAYDAGYLHAIIYGVIVVFFAASAAWFLFKITAPGLHAAVDRFYETDPAIRKLSENNEQKIGDAVKAGFALYAMYFIAIIFMIGQTV